MFCRLLNSFRIKIDDVKSVACSACKRPADSDVSIALSPLRKEERKTEQNQRTPRRTSQVAVPELWR